MGTIKQAHNVSLFYWRICGRGHSLLLVGLGSSAQGILQGGGTVLLTHIIKGLHHMLIPRTGAGAQLTGAALCATGGAAAGAATLHCTTTMGHDLYL